MASQLGQCDRHPSANAMTAWYNGAIKGRPDHSGATIDLWNTPTASSGAFPEAKRSGDVLRGARRSDR